MDRPKRDKHPPKGMMTHQALIDAVKKEPWIWDSNLREYHDRTSRGIAWNKVCRQFVAASPNDCRNTWNSLMRQKSSNRLLREKLTRSGAPAIKLPTFKWSKEMSFLEGVRNIDQLVGNLNDVEEEEENEPEESDSDTVVLNEDEDESEAEDDNQDCNEEYDKNEETDNIGNAMDFSLRSELDSHIDRINSSNQENCVRGRISFSTPVNVLQSVQQNRQSPLKLNNTQKVTRDASNNCERPTKLFPSNKENTPQKVNHKSKVNQKSKVNDAGRAEKRKRVPDFEKMDDCDEFSEEEDDVLPEGVLYQRKMSKKQEIFNARREAQKKKLDNAIAKARITAKQEISQKTIPSTSCGFENELQKELLMTLKKQNEEDSVTYFCLSLVDRIRALPARDARCARFKMEELLFQLEEGVASGSSDSPAAVGGDVASSFTKEMEVTATNILNSVSDNEVVKATYRITLRGRDMHTLREKGWLNDQVMNFYFQLIQERGKKNEFPCVYAFDTFYTVHSRIARLRNNINIFKDYEFLLLPLHINNNHWGLLITDIKERRVTYYDSMGGRQQNKLDEFMDYLADEHFEVTSEALDRNMWVKEHAQGIPKQGNSVDCGVFVCMFAEHVTRNAPISFTQEDMAKFRLKIVYDIHTMSLCH